MRGSRSDWKKLLPLIQEFVNGTPIEHKDYDNRWKPTDTLRDLLMAGDKYRVAPPDILRGVWTVQFEQTIPGSVDGPVMAGTMTWKGSNQDTPPWPQGSHIRLLMDTESFTEVIEGGDK